MSKSDKRILNGLEKTIRAFCRRKMKGAFRGEQSALLLRACSDRVAFVSATVLIETDERIEILAEITADTWTIAAVCKKVRRAGARLWSAGDAEILSVSGVHLDNVEAVVTWLELP